MNKLKQAKSKWLACLIVLLASVSTLAVTAKADSALPFDDISQSYAREQILDLYNRNGIDGTAPRTFEPDKHITRAEFITLLDRALRLQPVDSGVPAFTDVPKGTWFYGWIQAGVELGIADGISSEHFAPNERMTRQEAAELLVKALKQSSAMNAGSSVSTPFADSLQTAGWAVPYINQIYQMGLMEGDQQGFRPNDSMTRQETAVVMDKLFTVPRWSDALLASPSSRIQLGWQYNETDEQFEQQVLSSSINTLSPRWFFLDKNLVVQDAADPALVTWAGQNNKRIWAMVGNHSDMEWTHQVLSDAALTASVIGKLSEAAQKYNLDGLNIDFENVAPADRQGFTSFMASLAQELHAHNKVLSVNISPDAGTDWTEAFDYAALGQSADYVVLMAYDEHWAGDDIPGSVSSLPWVTQGIGKLLSSVPAAKVIAALPFYTRDWTSDMLGTSSTELTIREQHQLVSEMNAVPRWDGTTGQYMAGYELNNVPHMIWLEDSRSLALKYRAGLSSHVAGFAYWYTGGESADVWDSLMNTMKYDAYTF
ncbi:S-layer homology domain-containing protein [Paenibacillus rigui]|uniref:Glycoside hydrolase n=1 Tax=Paenibacillus rigui TaxID=554312 RepID=A0A229UK49_9BACL|nr:S-layer homology domain-containing protein [Paenibacillus rigui]OXM83751.1 glycoside hydrolase [Paenibacillus rigui]